MCAMLALAACVRNTAVKEQLLAVESIIEEYPDSALAVLKSMDSVSVHKIEETQALHALLLTQAFDKNYIDVKDDSLISIAVRYYEESDDIYHRMLAHFYHGRVLYNASKYPQSIVSTFKAYDEAKEIGDQYWLAMIARSISKIYNQTYSYIESLDYAKKALEHFRQTNKQKHMNWAYWNLAVAYRNCKLWDDCIHTATQGLDSAKKYNDIHLAHEQIRIIGSANFNAKRYPESIEAYSKLCCEYNTATAFDSVFLGLCYKRTGNTDKADEILSALPQNLDTYGSWLQNELCIIKGDTITAYNALLTLYNHSDNIIKTLMHQNMNGTVSKYFDAERKLEEAKADNATLRLWIFITLFVIIIIVFCIIAQQHSRKRCEINEKNLQIVQNLKRTIALNESANSDLRQQISQIIADDKHKHSELQQQVTTLLDSHFETLNKLCKMVYEKQSLKNSTQHISDAVFSMITDFANEKTETLEGVVNEYYDNAISELKQELPKLKEADYLLFIYSVLGFSSDAIAMLLKEEKTDSVYERKRRLKAKIKQLDTSKQNKFIKLIS